MTDDGNEDFAVLPRQPVQLPVVEIAAGKIIASGVGTNPSDRTYEFVSVPYNLPSDAVSIPAVCVHEDGFEHPVGCEAVLPCEYEPNSKAVNEGSKATERPVSLERDTDAATRVAGTRTDYVRVEPIPAECECDYCGNPAVWQVTPGLFITGELACDRHVAFMCRDQLVAGVAGMEQTQP